MSKDYVIAVYDFRSKQEYIYRTDKVKEIIGASEVIKNIYSNVISKYSGIEYVDYNKTKEIPIFCLEETLQQFNQLKQKAIVLYEGGGNIVMLFKNEEELIHFNKYFSLYLIKYAPGLTPICGRACFKDLADEKFFKVREKVFKDLDEYRRIAQPILHANVLPFTQIDRKTSLPVTNKNSSVLNESSGESYTKLKAFRSITKEENADKYVQNFDWLIEKKGKESLMAIIYIDGNGMGQLVKNYIDEDIGFEEGVNIQRKLTKKINDAFVNRTIKAIEEEVGRLSENGKQTNDNGQEENGKYAMRRIIGGGDEITIVCNARSVHKVLEAYFDSLEASSKEEVEKGEKQGFSACAGVAVCHSHAPFADIYAIAEECCENGKKRIKKLKEEGSNNSYIDAYFCHSAITGDLETLRERVGSNHTNMPYCRTGNDGKEHSYKEGFVRIGKELQKVNRTNVKALRDAAFNSKSDFELELLRVKSNCSKEIDINIDDMPILCDVAEFYDLWFDGEVDKDA